MGRLIKASRPSPAIVIAALALVAAVAGTAFAGTEASTSAINKKKVKKIATKQINKRFPVGTEDIADGAVTGAKVAERSITAGDLAPGTIPAPSAGVIQGNTQENLLTVTGSEDVYTPSGFNEVEPTPAASIQSSPNARLVVRDLFARVGGAPGAGASRTVDLVAFNPGRVLLSCTIAGTATTCNSGAQSATVPPGTMYRVSIRTGTPAPAPSAGASWAFRALTP